MYGPQKEIDHQARDRQIYFIITQDFRQSSLETYSLGINISRDAIVMDPWNGADNHSSRKDIGISAIGLDLNPVMVIVAKAKL